MHDTRKGELRRPTSRVTVIVGLACVLMLEASCSDKSKADDPVLASATPNGATADRAEPSASAPATNPAVTIEGFGLTVSPPTGEPPKAVRFGDSQATTIGTISRVLGKPAQQGTNSDCPSGPVQFATWSKGLSANFEDGKFAGWAGAVDQRTARGIGFGSSRTDLVKAYHPTFEQTSLGYEFTADGISGVLESDAPDAAITDLWAGVSCVAR